MAWDSRDQGSKEIMCNLLFPQNTVLEVLWVGLMWSEIVSWVLSAAISLGRGLEQLQKTQPSFERKCPRER